MKSLKFNPRTLITSLILHLILIKKNAQSSCNPYYNLKFCCKWLTVILTIILYTPYISLGQDCDGSPSPALQIDHRTNCPGASCTANDVTLLGFELVGPGPCLDCDPGDAIEMTLFVVVDHGTNSDRPALVVMGDLSNGTTSCNFVKCDGSIIKNSNEPLTDDEYPSDGKVSK